MSDAVAISRKKEAPTCLVRSVSKALATEPKLEAVVLNHDQQAISIATFGQVKEPGLEERVTSAVGQGQEISSSHRCNLLSGEGDCFTCDIPLALDEARPITIHRDPASTTIARLTCPTAPRFWQWRRIPWPRIAPREFQLPHSEDDLDEWKNQLAAAILCGACGIAAALTGGALSLGLFIAAFAAGGWFAAQEVWERLQMRILDVHFLMLAVAAGSASIGAWGEGATLLFLFSLSGALEHFAMGRTQREIRSLFKTAPKTATLLDGGSEQEVAVELLQPGMRLLIKPGNQFPVDAEIAVGQTASDESNLTGESTPVDKKVGDTVLAGTLNLWGAVEAMVVRPAKESALQKIIHLIREAQGLKAPSQRLTDKFGTTYTYVILAVTIVMFFVWWLGLGLTPLRSIGAEKSAFYRAMTLLVVASPCALVLSIPSAILAAIATGARRGILFRGGAAVEKLAEVNIVALDKTGTLTTGELEVDQVESFPRGREEEVLLGVFSLERLSTHPLARSISRHAKRARIAPLNVEHFESVTGQGIKGTLNGQPARAGRREWLADVVTPLLNSRLSETEPGFSEVWFVQGDLIGRVLLRDKVRPQAKEVLAGLRNAGLKSVVLTGDRPATAERLKAMLGLEDVRAGLAPEEKLEIIRGYTERGDRVAMVGDGVNDAPSLAAAHVGVAMGTRGADAALEQAEVVLMNDRLENFLAAFQLSQRARRIIHQNLFLSLGTVVVLVGLAMFGAIPLTLGVIGHEGSTVVVVINSLRLLLGNFRPAASPS